MHIKVCFEPLCCKPIMEFNLSLQYNYGTFSMLNATFRSYGQCGSRSCNLVLDLHCLIRTKKVPNKYLKNLQLGRILSVRITILTVRSLKWGRKPSI